MFLSRHLPGLFGSFREYTFQIFLMGIFFQIAIRFIYAKLGIACLYWPLYIVSILLALYMPVLISKAIRKQAARRWPDASGYKAHRRFQQAGLPCTIAFPKSMIHENTVSQ